MLKMREQWDIFVDYWKGYGATQVIEDLSTPYVKQLIIEGLTKESLFDLDLKIDINEMVMMIKVVYRWNGTILLGESAHGHLFIEVRKE